MSSTKQQNSEWVLRYSIYVAGAAAGITVDGAHELATAVGEEVAKSGHVLTTGATVGLPYFAAVGAKKQGGMNIGFSPAANMREHIRKYRLPHDVFDFINFTGMNYVGRDLYSVQSSDAVITIGGRFGTLHEFTSALEDHKPCGILLGSGGTADEVPHLMKILSPPHGDLVVFDKDPARLVKKIIAILDKKDSDIIEQLKKHDEHWFLKPTEKIKRQG